MKHARLVLALALALGSFVADASLHAADTDRTPLEQGVYPLGEGLYLIVCDAVEIDADGHICKIIIGTLEKECSAKIVSEGDGTIVDMVCSAKPQCKSRDCRRVVERFKNGNPVVGCDCIDTARQGGR